MSDERKYVRVYYSVIDDERFAGIYGNDRNLAAWLRLLMIADACWPSSGDLPRWLGAAPLRALVASGLVELPQPHRFRIHGLDAERTARRNAASNAAASRWHSEGNAETMPSKAEHSQAKTNRSEVNNGVDVGDGSPIHRLVNLGEKR